MSLGDFWLQFNNGKKINLSGIHDGINIDENNEFLKKYDKNSNSIFDADEIEKLKEDAASYLADGVLDKREMVSWFAKLFGFSVESLKTDNESKNRSMSDISDLVGNSINDLVNKSAQADCVEYLKSNGLNMTTDMLTRDNGTITELYDKIKNNCDDSLSPNYIYSIIFSEVLSAQFLEEANNGTLTKQDYIERKINATKAMMMHKIMGEYFESEFANLDVPKEQLEVALSGYFDKYFAKLVEYASNNYDSEQGNVFDSISWNINNLIEGLLQNEELEKKFFKKVFSEVKQDISDFYKNCDTMTTDNQKPDLKYLYINNNISFAEADLLNFEQVFKLEKGMDFNPEAYQEFQEAKNEMERVMAPFNKMSVMNSRIEDVREDLRKSIAYTPHSAAFDKVTDVMGKSGDVPKAEDKIQKICNLFNEYYANNAEQAANDLNNIIQSKKILGLRVGTTDGKLNMSFTKQLNTDSDKLYALIQMLDAFEETMASRFESILGGKPLENYMDDYNSKQKKALGNTNIETLIDAYKADNGTVIQKYTGAVKTTGMVATFVGGILCLTPAAGVGVLMTAAGGKMAIGGMVADYTLEYTEALTKDEISTEELEDITKYCLMDAGGFIIGFKAGQKGNQAFAKLLDKKLASVLKQEITAGNRIKALKTVLSQKTLLKNFMSAAGAKVGTDFLISYVGDLVMMGVLDTDDNWESLLKQNLLGIVIGSSGDLADVGRLTVKNQQRYRELKQKQHTSILNDAELKELAALEKELVKPAKTKTDEKVDAANTEIEAKTYHEYNKSIMHGVDLIDMTDEQLSDYYKHLVPNISENELKYLIGQIHRIKNGEARYLCTQEELDILFSVEDKMIDNFSKSGFFKNYPGFYTENKYDISIHKPADIPFEPKDISPEMFQRLQVWWEYGFKNSIDEVYNDMGTVLTQDTYLFRGVSVRTLQAWEGITLETYTKQSQFLNSIKEGTFIDNSNRYTSTATAISSAYGIGVTFNQAYMLKIKVPKGTKVVDMRYHKQNSKEIVLPPCLYKVNHIDYNTGIVDCEYIPISDQVKLAKVESEVKPKKTKLETENRPAETPKPENTKIETGKNSDLVNEFDAYIKGLAEHGEDYVPEFMDKASPLFKEYFDSRKEFIRSQREKGKTIKILDRMGYLKDIENFILTKSQIATREDYVKITDEIAKLMPEYIKTKYPKVRPEIAENADKIYKWKAAMSGQRPGGIPDANGKYPITTDKFFDAEAHDKAVEEFTAFLENMTGKKVLVDNTAIFGTFIDQLGVFNNPDFYKDVDYIVLGHGTGSSLVKDSSAPNTWKFKYSGQPVWDFIAKNVPEGKKALLLVCEHDGKTQTERKEMPEMYDDNGIYMKGIGDVASGYVTAPAKIVVGGINHIVGTVECQQILNARELMDGIGGKVTVKKYSVNNISKRIDLDKTSYTTYTDKDGNKIYKVVATATPNKKVGGYDFTYDVYKVDAEGNIIDEIKGVTDKEIKEKYGKLKNEEIHDNSGSDNSGYAYSGIPFFKNILDMVIGNSKRSAKSKKAHDAAQKPGEIRISEYDEIETNANITNGFKFISAEQTSDSKNLYRFKLPDGRIVALESSKVLSVGEMNNAIEYYYNQTKKIDLLINNPKLIQIHSGMKNMNVAQIAMLNNIDGLLELFDTNSTCRKQAETMLDEIINTKNYQKLEELSLYLQANAELSGKAYGIRNAFTSDDGKTNCYISDLGNLAYSTYKNNGLKLDDWASQKIQRYDNVKSDISQLQHWDSAIRFMKMYPESEASQYFYKLHLESVRKASPELADKLNNVHQKYGLKLFLPSAISKSEALKAMDYIDAELKLWMETSDNKAKIPPVIQFNSAHSNFQIGNADGLSEPLLNNSLHLPALGLYHLRFSLRHELTHTNDLKYTNGFKAAPFGDIRANKKYWDEFKNAGIREDHIDYAYTNSLEFIAVASEGDFSKYSAEFKEVLVSLGMPKWELDMPQNPYCNIDSEVNTTPKGDNNLPPLLAHIVKMQQEKISFDSKIPVNMNVEPEDSSGTTPQIITTEEFAKHVKVPYVNSLYRLKGIVINKGKIDLSIPANKYIYDNYRPREKKVSTETYPKQEAPANLTPTGKTKRGRKSKGAEEPKKTPGTQGTTSNQTPPSKELSIADYAEMLGLSKKTVDLFIEKGNIIVNKNNKIDINNPKNQEFTKSAVNLVEQLAAPRVKTEQNKGQSSTSEATTPRFVSIAEFANMIGIRVSNVYVLKGLIITEDPQTNHKMIDINVESNKEIIRRYHVKNYAEILGLSEKTVEFYIKKGNIIVNEDGTIDLKNSVNKEFTKYAMDLVGKMVNHKANETPKAQLAYERNWEGKSVEEKLLELGFEDAALIKDLYPEKAEKFLKALETLDLYIDKSKINEKTSSDIFDKNEIPDILVDTKDNPVKIENLQQLFDKANMINRLNKVKQEVNKLLGGKTSSLIDGKSYNEGTFISVINGKVYTILDITGKETITRRDLQVFSSCPVGMCKKLGISKIDTEEGLKIVMEQGKDIDIVSIQRIWDAIYGKNKLPVSINENNPKYPISEINFTSNSITITMRDGNKMDMSTFMALYKHCFGEKSVSSLNEDSLVSIYTDEVKEVLNNEFSKNYWSKTEQPANLWYELPKLRTMWMYPHNDKFNNEILPDLLMDKMWDNTCFKTYRSRLRFLEKVILKEDIKWDGKQSKIWSYYQRKLTDHKSIADKIKQFDDMVKDKISSGNLHVEKASDKSGIPCIKFRFDDKVYGIGIGECNTDDGYFIETVYRTKDFVF